MAAAVAGQAKRQAKSALAVTAPPKSRATPPRAASPQVFESLRAEIISLRLAPGTVLSRADLQAQFGVSSTPIRDVLMRLEEEGLVDIFPQHATVVSLIDVPKARQAQILRRAQEQETVRILAEDAGRELSRRLNAIVDHQKQLAADQHFDAFDDADRDFHRTLFDAAGTPGLWSLMRSRSGHLDRIRRLNLPAEGKMDQIIRDHARIVRAVASGKPLAAQEAMRDHLSRSVGHWDAMRRQFPGHFREDTIGMAGKPNWPKIT